MATRHGTEDPVGRGHLGLRYDTTDKKGAITLRRAGRLHHLQIRAAHAGRRILAIVDEREVTVVALDTGEVLSGHRIEPDRDYWRKTFLAAAGFGTPRRSQRTLWLLAARNVSSAP